MEDGTNMNKLKLVIIRNKVLKPYEYRERSCFVVDGLKGNTLPQLKTLLTFNLEDLIRARVFMQRTKYIAPYGIFKKHEMRHRRAMEMLPKIREEIQLKEALQ